MRTHGSEEDSKREVILMTEVVKLYDEQTVRSFHSELFDEDNASKSLVSVRDQLIESAIDAGVSSEEMSAHLANERLKLERAGVKS